jgi:SAM-dependent methyltransferase
MPTPSQIRHGRIDEMGDLAGFDILKFNDGINPWGGAEFTETGFHHGAAHYRKSIEKWDFANLGKVADLGSGFGRWSLFLGEVNEEVHGFERNEGGVALSQKLAHHFSFDNVYFQAADVTALPADCGPFDGVWCYGTLHLVHREKALQEIHRVLKPGGVVFLGKLNSAGRVLARFFKGYRDGGMTDHRVRNALNALKQGPLYNGKGSYTTRETIEQTLQQFGFELSPNHPVQLESAKSPPSGGPLIEALRDLPALGERLESDATFTAEFARHPDLTHLYPIGLNLCAIKV